MKRRCSEAAPKGASVPWTRKNLIFSVDVPANALDSVDAFIGSHPDRAVCMAASRDRQTELSTLMRDLNLLSVLDYAVEPELIDDETELGAAAASRPATGTS